MARLLRPRVLDRQRAHRRLEPTDPSSVRGVRVRLVRTGPEPRRGLVEERHREVEPHTEPRPRHVPRPERHGVRLQLQSGVRQGPAVRDVDAPPAVRRGDPDPLHEAVRRAVDRHESVGQPVEPTLDPLHGRGRCGRVPDPTGEHRVGRLVAALRREPVVVRRCPPELEPRARDLVALERDQVTAGGEGAVAETVAVPPLPGGPWRVRRSARDEALGARDDVAGVRPGRRPGEFRGHVEPQLVARCERVLVRRGRSTSSGTGTVAEARAAMIPGANRPEASTTPFRDSVQQKRSPAVEAEW